MPGNQTYDFYRKFYKINKSKLFITGYARNDYLFKSSKREKNLFYEKLKLNKNYKTVMYAPTWSHDHKNQLKKGLFPIGWGDEIIILEDLIKYLKSNVHPLDKRCKTDP